ncbi:hypothetical protein QMK33_04860 [Hymenobacter sp. H14-R3]|uniref:hypothetical protein n=1 Tax=Hymenobacter sp. H14-R3 TaxID=3046308 RepID=UPI0024B98C59|nr:hypothetical protein [Hymenobacter sp. H14-R3]MDJ0364473.1 hypothetical protein [Hymenobacter sp. H14-R3]
MTTGLPTELLHLTYRPDLAILIGRWGYQPTPAELPAQYERLAAIALQHGAQRWLQDIRHRNLNDPYTTQWLLTEYFPDMAEQLAKPLRVAYLVGPTLRGLIEAAPDFQPLASYQGRPFIVGFFGEEGAAIAWLKEG